jgi:colanic acid/amylovoran biosynthesis glycosyltransferase
MIDAGHEVDIFARFHPDEGQTHAVVDEYNLLGKTIYSNTPISKLRRIPSAIQLLASRGWREPKKIFESLNAFEFGRDALSLQLLHASTSFPDGNPDVLHCHFGPNGNFGALLKRLDEIQRLVVSFHGSDIHLALNEKRDLYDPVFKSADAILVNSEYNLEKLVELGADRSDLIRHPVGVNIERFPYRWRDYNPTDANDVVLLTIGRLVEEKGYLYGLRAVADVVDRFGDQSFEYRIVGSGDKEHELKALTEELGLENVVRFLGQKTTKEVIEELGKAHVFMLPSINEGFGKVLLEAQVTGLPFVGTTAGGIPEATNGGSAGYLAPPGDAEALADQLTEVVRNRDRWMEMGWAGREFVKENYDTRQLNQELEDIYQRIA